MQSPSMCDCKCNKPNEIDEYLDIKNYLCKKLTFGKLLSACEDEMLITTKTLLNDKKETQKEIIALFTLFYC